MTGKSIIEKFRLHIATRIFQQSSTAFICGLTSTNDPLIDLTRLIVSSPDGGSSKGFIQEGAMSEFSIWHVVSHLIFQFSDPNDIRKASPAWSTHEPNLNEPLALQKRRSNGSGPRLAGIRAHEGLHTIWGIYVVFRQCVSCSAGM